MKKLLLLLGLMGLSLIGCQNQPAQPRVNTDMSIYTTFELGPNFTTHMWAMALEKNIYTKDIAKDLKGQVYDHLPAWYSFAYTNAVDELWPQIFYFMPLNHDFSSQDQWQLYFDSWRQALATQDIKPVEVYMEDSHLSTYIEERFASHPQEAWADLIIGQLDIFDELTGFYLEAFQDYEKKVWPQVTYELKEKSIAINESLSQNRLVDQWLEVMALTLEVPRYKFSLTYVGHDDFDYVEASDHTFITGYNHYEDPYAYRAYISQRVGYDLLTQNQGTFFYEIYETYKESLKAYNIFDEVTKLVEFTAAQYNSLLMGYKTPVYNKYLGTDASFDALVWFHDPLQDGQTILRQQMQSYLEILKGRQPYLEEGQVYYKDVAYTRVYASDQWTLYGASGLPLIEQTPKGLKLLNQAGTSLPVYSMDQSEIAYISPFNRKAIGNIYVLDLKTRTPEVLLELSPVGETTVKSVALGKGDACMAIIGFKDHTFGGDNTLYKIDRHTGQKTRVDISLGNKESMESIQYSGGKWLLEVVSYTTSYKVAYSRYLALEGLFDDF